jgi:hypothetical protein
MQRPPILAARERPVGIGGARPGAGGIHGADGVQRRVVLLDPGKVEPDQLGGRETARANAPGELGGAGERVDALV